MSSSQPFEALLGAGDYRLAAHAFYSLADSIPQLVWSCCADGRCDYVNKRFLEFSGLSPGECTGHDWTRSIHSADLGFAVTLWKSATEKRTGFEMQCRLRSKKGNYRWFHLRAVPLVEANEVTRWFLISTDINDQKRPTGARDESEPENEVRTPEAPGLHAYNEQVEMQVADRTRQLRETITQLEGFAYSLAHDMRAPCRVLTGYSQILLRDHAENLAEEPREFLRRISTAADRLDAFVRDLLVYSRIAHDRMPLEDIDVEQVLADVIASMPNLQPPLADLVMESPFHSVLANDTLLSQCFTNLLTNACKFVTKGEKPSIRIFDERSEGKVRVYIEDNGIGIPEADLERVFNVFERLHSEKEYSGTGVGLSIVRKAVERMGGKVGVVSQPGKGSKFWLELKASTAPV